MDKPYLIDKYLRAFIYYTDRKVPLGLCQAIAETVGVSREYVRQRANILKLTPARKIPKKKKICVNCKKKYLTYRYKQQKYCSPTCRKEAHLKKYYIALICKECKEEFIVYRTQRHQQYCSRKCMGKWLSQFNKTNHLYPLTVQETKNIVEKKMKGKIFTVKDFVEIFKYNHYGTAYGILESFVIRGIVKKFRIGNKNEYRFMEVKK